LVDLINFFRGLTFWRGQSQKNFIYKERSA